MVLFVLFFCRSTLLAHIHFKVYFNPQFETSPQNIRSTENIKLCVGHIFYCNHKRINQNNIQKSTTAMKVERVETFKMIPLKSYI